MGIIKGVLREELNNSVGMLARYQEEASRMKGCLVKKKIGKRYYFYLVRREGSKVKFIYKGSLSKKVQSEYRQQRKKLAQYKHLIAKVKNQISFLKKALHGKESV